MKQLAFILSLFITCTAGERTTLPTPKDFSNYWYQGKAEVSSYKLEQARYGEMRKGNTVLIFVTEDYSKEKHIKINTPTNNGDNDLVKILKLNMDKKFNTGFYPYSLMQSTFTPVDLDTYPNSMRVTATVQEWCGHTFSMLDRKKDKYEYTLHSYFDGEGDQQHTLGEALLEDEIWTLIRIDYKKLPIGGIKVIPSLLAQRLSHRPLQAENATASMTEEGNNLIYRLKYKNFDRVLSIRFEKEFPHKILGWEETYMSGFGANAKKMTTKATLNKTLITDYWSKNSNSDSYLRKELGLE